MRSQLHSQTFAKVCGEAALGDGFHSAVGVMNYEAEAGGTELHDSL